MLRRSHLAGGSGKGVEGQLFLAVAAAASLLPELRATGGLGGDDAAGVANPDPGQRVTFDRIRALA